MFKSTLKRFSRTKGDASQRAPPKSIKSIASPILQPINIMDLNHVICAIDPNDTIDVEAREATRSSVKIQSRARNVSRRLKQRATSKEVSALMNILITLAPADFPSHLSKGSDSATRTVCGSEVASPSAAPSKKQIKSVTGKLSQAKKAKKIIANLRSQRDPILARANMPIGYVSVRGVCLVKPDDANMPTSLPDEYTTPMEQTEKALSSRLDPPHGIINLITGLSFGNVLAVMAQTSGLFDALARCSAEMIENSSAHEQLIGLVPTDRVSVWKYWWGFEIALPPPSIVNLAKAKSISATFLQLLLGLTVSGGIVELIPFIRYLSAYIDMEWKAIESQDKGHGVVLAATWALPPAVIPRSWDFGPGVSKT